MFLMYHEWKIGLSPIINLFRNIIFYVYSKLQQLMGNEKENIDSLHRCSSLLGKAIGVYKGNFIHPCVVDVVGLILQLVVIGLDLYIPHCF